MAASSEVPGESYNDTPSILLPCVSCNRTFRPAALAKHSKVCEKSLMKKRKKFDSSKQRIQGTDLAEFLPILPTFTRKVDKSPIRKPQNKWREKHNELVQTIKAARLPPGQVPLTPMKLSDHEQCPYCERTFGPKAYDRHLEWCKEQQTRIKPRSPNSQRAKERVEARTKYRAPLTNKCKLRSTSRDKFPNSRRDPSPLSQKPSHYTPSTPTLTRKKTSATAVTESMSSPVVNQNLQKGTPLRSSTRSVSSFNNKRTPQLSRCLKLPSPSPTLKLNSEEVNLHVPELSITSCTLMEDLSVEVKTEAATADCDSSMISTNDVQRDIVDDFLITNTPDEIAADMIYADDTMPPVKLTWRDSFNGLLETQRTELNKTYSKDDLKQLVKCNTVKSRCLDNFKFRDEMKSTLEKTSLLNKSEIGKLITPGRKNKDIEKDPILENLGSKNICLTAPIKDVISCVKSKIRNVNFLFLDIVYQEINHLQDDSGDINCSQIKTKIKECRSNYKTYIVTLSDQVLYSVLNYFLLSLEVKIDFPYLFIGKEYKDILLLFCNEISNNCRSKKLSKIIELTGNELSIPNKKASRLKSTDSNLKNKKCTRSKFLEQLNVEVNKPNEKHSKNTLANTSTSYDLLDGTTFSEYSSDQFWDYYGIETFKEGTKYSNHNDPTSSNLQGEKQEQDYLTYEMFVNELHSLTKQSNLSTDSLDTKSYTDNLSASSSRSSENYHIENNDRCFDYIKKLPSIPSANKYPETVKLDDLKCDYQCSVSSKWAINKTRYINVRSYDCEETTYFQINSCGEKTSTNLLRRDHKSSYFEKTISHNFEMNQSATTDFNNYKGVSNSKETWYRKRNDSQNLSDSFKLDQQQAMYPSKLPRLCSSVLTRKTVSLPLLKNRPCPGNQSVSNSNKSPGFSAKDSTKLPDLSTKCATRETKQTQWFKKYIYADENQQSQKFSKQSPRNKEQRFLPSKPVSVTGVKSDKKLPNMKHHKLLPIKSEPTLQDHSSLSKIQVEAEDVFIDNLEDFCKWKATNGREFKTFKFEDKPKSSLKYSSENITRKYEEACRTLESLNVGNRRMRFPNAVNKVVTNSRPARKRGSKDPEPYDPFKSAERQMLELLEPMKEPPKPVPISLSPPLVSSPTSAFTKFTSLHSPEPLFISEDDNSSHPIKDDNKSVLSSDKSDSPLTITSIDNFSSSKDSNQNPISLSTLSLCSTISIESVENNKNANFRVGLSNSAKVPEKKTPQPIRRTVSAVENRRSRDPFRGKLKMEDMLYGNSISDGERYFGSPNVLGCLESDIDDLNNSNSLFKTISDAETLNAEQELLKSVTEFEKLLSSSPSPTTPPPKLFPSLVSSYPVSDLEKHENDFHPSQMYGPDSAYSSLNRKSPVGGEEYPSAETAAASVAKFCHECGNKYPVLVAKFCCQCGVRRLAI